MQGYSIRKKVFIAQKTRKIRSQLLEPTVDIDCTYMTEMNFVCPAQILFNHMR